MNYIDKLFDLENKIVLITGGGGVLAGAIGQGFANAGASVILAGIRIENTISNANKIIENGGKAEALLMDALNKEDTGPYLSQSHTIILDFLSAKIGESLLGKTHSDIKTILIAASVSEPIVDQVITILEKLSFLAYAPDTEGRASLSQVESEMKSLFAELRESL